MKALYDDLLDAWNDDRPLACTMLLGAVVSVAAIGFVGVLILVGLVRGLPYTLVVLPIAWLIAKVLGKINRDAKARLR